jgi:hypothetical protein
LRVGPVSGRRAGVVGAGVGHDDHTFHFTDTRPFTDAAEEAGFTVEKAEIFKRYFFLIARKPI